MLVLTVFGTSQYFLIPSLQKYLNLEKLSGAIVNRIRHISILSYP